MRTAHRFCHEGVYRLRRRIRRVSRGSSRSLGARRCFARGDRTERRHVARPDRGSILFVIDGLGMAARKSSWLTAPALRTAGFDVRVCALQVRQGNPAARDLQQRHIPVDLVPLRRLLDFPAAPLSFATSMAATSTCCTPNSKRPASSVRCPRAGAVFRPSPRCIRSKPRRVVLGAGASCSTGCSSPAVHEFCAYPST